MAGGKPSAEFALAGRIAALAAAAVVATRFTVDPDLWGHLRFGLDTLATRHLTSVDPYSFTQDIPWINHEWLSEVVLALAYRAGGVTGIVLLKAGLVAAALGLLFLAARRVPGAMRWWLPAAAAAAMAPAAFSNRPQLWTLLGIAIVWHALAGRRPPIWIPIVFAIWANLHGGWIVGLGIFGLWLLGRAIDERRLGELRMPALALALSAAATIVNPYGVTLWTFLASTVRMARNVTEWQPIWRQVDASAAVLWIVVAGAIVLPTVVARRRRLTWAAGLPVLWLGVSSALVTRLVPIFGEIAALALAAAWESRDRSSASPAAGFPSPAFLIVDAVVVVAIASVFLGSEVRCVPIAGYWVPDRLAASALASPDVTGRLVVPFDWGEYAIWHFGPRLRVSMDGRRETVYSQQTIDAQADLSAGLASGLEELGRERPDYVWLPATVRDRLAPWLAANGYRMDVNTTQSFIATRADRPVVAIGEALPGCFP